MTLIQAAGTVQPCFTSACIENVDGNSPDAEHQREVIQDTSAMVPTGMSFNIHILFSLVDCSSEGGADTTSSAVETFILAMLNFPEIQRKAQEEVDRVVGRSRLPDFADEADLPYLSAVVKEVFRLVG
jgi:hypothetical protein